MALGDPSMSISTTLTVTHPASTPSSVLAPSFSTPTPTSSATPFFNNSNGPFFQMGASPPLIIGLIAIGGFCLGVVTLCVWRRMTGRDILGGPVGMVGRGFMNDGGIGGAGKLGKKPELFEVWWDESGMGVGAKAGAEGMKSVDEGDGVASVVSGIGEKGKERASGEWMASRDGLSWQSLMPISATIVSDDTPEEPSSPATPPSPTHSIGHRRTSSILSGLGHRPLSLLRHSLHSHPEELSSDSHEFEAPPSSNSDPLKQEEQEGSTPEKETAARNASLQVAVVLAMPSKRRSQLHQRRMSMLSQPAASSSNDDGKSPTDSASSGSGHSEIQISGETSTDTGLEELEYSIGLIEIPWARGGLEGKEETDSPVGMGLSDTAPPRRGRMVNGRFVYAS